MLLLLSWTAFSQSGTVDSLPGSEAFEVVASDTNKRITFTYETARRIANDLVAGDAAIEELEEYKVKTRILERKLESTLLVDQALEGKVTSLQGDLDLSANHIDTLNKYNTALTEANNVLSSKVRFLGVTVAITAAVLVGALLIK